MESTEHSGHGRLFAHYGEQLVWEYPNGSVTRMNRICTLPPEKEIPERARVTD